jgi:hypothetical protein
VNPDPLNVKLGTPQSSGSVDTPVMPASCAMFVLRERVQRDDFVWPKVAVKLCTERPHRTLTVTGTLS